MLMAYQFYPQLTLTEEAIKAWHADFAQESCEDFDQAMKLARNEPGREFFPTPGVVRKYLDQIKARKPGVKPEKTAGQLWLIARNIASRGDERHRQALFEQYPAAYQATLQVGGFDKISLASHDTLPFIQRDWLRFYEELKDQQKARKHLEITDLPTRVKNLLNTTMGGKDDEDRHH